MFSCLPSVRLAVANYVARSVNLVLAGDGLTEAGLAVAVRVELDGNFDVAALVSVALLLTLFLSMTPLYEVGRTI